MFSHRVVIRIIYVFALLLLVAAAAGLYVLLQSKEYAFEHVAEPVAAETLPFPVGVDPETRTIVEADLFNAYTNENLAIAEDTQNSFWENILAVFTKKEWYQNLASPVSRIVVIWPGDRKEEAAKNIGDILRWNEEDREEFISLITTTEPVMVEGTFYPGKYMAHRGATPEDMAILIQQQFNDEIKNRYTPEVAEKVPLQDALIIASLLEREASDFENMREVSGVIWNRLFIDMPLQLDATLQYVRGSRATESSWWPVPRPADKYLNSPYNTYQNEGLPPAPIANPSADAVLAALNPSPTDCLYYFHDSYGGYHCSIDYEEHVRKLKAAYGRGQ